MEDTVNWKCSGYTYHTEHHRLATQCTVEYQLCPLLSYTGLGSLLCGPALWQNGISLAQEKIHIQNWKYGFEVPEVCVLPSHWTCWKSQQNHCESGTACIFCESFITRCAVFPLVHFQWSEITLGDYLLLYYLLPITVKSVSLLHYYIPCVRTMPGAS